MEEKLLNRLRAALLKDFRLKNMDWSKYQLTFVVAEEVLSRPLLSLLIKNGSPFHSSALRVSSYTTFSAKKKTCFEFSRTYWLKSRLLATLWLLGGLRRVRNSCSRFARQQLVIETKCTKYLSLNYTARELFYNGCNQYSRSLSLLLVL